MILDHLLFWVYTLGVSVLWSIFYCCYIYDDVLKGQFEVIEDGAVYDFVVVGAGTAGIIVASRLAENPSHKVLLLEAGDESNFILDIPVFAPLLQFSRYDWKYLTEPQKHACLGLQSNSSRWPRGKVVGGSSRLNYALYVRGQQEDFDSWSNQGNEGWNYSEILPYLKKSEKQRGRFKDDDAYHSVKGEWSVSDPPWLSPMADSVLSAAKELGMEIVDFNGKGKTGFMVVQVNLENGARSSSESALLSDALQRGNLKLITNAQVEKVIFEEFNKVQGVSYMKHGSKYIAKVEKEVILSAGAIETPKILMLSGIGPKGHLASFEIPVLRDLPVGKNLQDHIGTGSDLVLLEKKPVTFASIASPVSAAQYFLQGSGPWTVVACETMGFFHSTNENSTNSSPDIQLMTLPFGLTLDGGSHLKKITGISDETWSEYFEPLVSQHTASIMPILLHPRSRGEILLHSTDPLEPPRINPRYLSHPEDVKVLIEGLGIVKSILNTTAMKDFGARLNEKVFPGCDTFDFDSDPYWECYIRHLTLTSYHPVGTCKMGPVGDESAVVDPKLRVHGIRNLRVVDASIMPTIVSGNTNAATMMIGEKGADMIKAYWNAKGDACVVREESCPQK